MDNLAIGVLITWRLTALLYLERGPFAIFDHLRQLVGIYTELDPVKGETRAGKNEIAKALTCYWCTSVWVAALVALLLRAPVLHLFAYSAGAIILWEWVHGN
jgi:hypothetical protein